METVKRLSAAKAAGSKFSALAEFAAAAAAHEDAGKAAGGESSIGSCWALARDIAAAAEAQGATPASRQRCAQAACFSTSYLLRRDNVA